VTDPSSNRLSLSFKEISDALSDFVLPPTDLVIGIGRGGVVPASLTAFKLKCDMQIVEVNYRNDQNNPVRPSPTFLANFSIKDQSVRRILLVDDVSVSGSTMNLVKARLSDYDVTTFVMKGNADFVLFPDIRSCVNWPWSQSQDHAP